MREYTPFWSFFGPTDEVKSYRFALLSQSISQSVSQSGRFHSNGPLEFSDFWYQGSFLLLLKTDGAEFFSYLPVTPFKKKITD